MSQASSSLPRLVVLISGSGSNLQAFLDGAADSSLGGTVAAVISNRPNVKGLDRAAAANVPALVVDHTEFDSRESFDLALAEQIDQFRPDIVILAGFMRILTPAFIRRYQGKMLNIHPSLLPKYPGLHTHQRAIDAGDSEGGATVHFVTEELDGGPPILQAKVAIDAGDDANALAGKVLRFEHQIYPLATRWLCEGRLKMSNGKAVLDGETLPPSGLTFKDMQ